jgi:endonuclease YncB( thermonuclease family)
MLPANLLQSVVPLEAQSDRDLLKHLQDHVQAANTIVDLFAQREIGRHHLSTMRQLELQLVAIIPNISDLEQGLEEERSKQPVESDEAKRRISDRAATQLPQQNPQVQASSRASKLARAVRFWRDLRPRTRWTIYACLIAALAPIGIRWGSPILLHQVEQAGLIKAFSRSTSTVKTIDGNTWIIAPPNQPIQSLQLAGIEPINPSRIAEANSVLSMIVHASDNQVSVTTLPHSSRALLRLPTGLLLQEILVRAGFAKLDAKQLSLLPQETVTQLEKAQAQARAQHQNLWDDE